MPIKKIVDLDSINILSLQGLNVEHCKKSVKTCGKIIEKNKFASACSKSKIQRNKNE